MFRKRVWIAVVLGVMLSASMVGRDAAGARSRLVKVGPRSFGSGLPLTSAHAHGKTVVATGSDGRLIVSRDDGRTWVMPASPVGSNLRGIAYSAGRWVAVGDVGAAATSLDAVHWSALNLGSQAAFRAITGGAGRWVAGGTAGTVLVSTNGGQSWTQATVGTQLPFWGAATWHGVTILSGDNGQILRSTNGTTWTRFHVPVRYLPDRGMRAFLWQATHGRPGFVIVGGVGSVVFSKDGVHWSVQRAPLTQLLRGVTYGKGRYVAVGEDGQIGASADGRRWALVRHVPTSMDLRGVTFTGDSFIAVGDYGTVIRSADGVHWRVVLDGSRQSLSSVAFGHGEFVAVGAAGRVVTSHDGLRWTRVSSRTSQQLYGVARGRRGFVAVGARGTILRSLDGRTWRPVVSRTPETLRTAAFLGHRWYAAGDNGVILSSADGVRWRRQRPLTGFSIRQFAEGDGLQVLAGAGVIASRRPVGSWALNPAGNYHFALGVAFGRGRFVVVGHVGGVASSTNGSVWTVAPRPTLENLDAIAFHGGLWVTAALSYLATSGNAVTWTQRPIPTRSSIRSIVHGNGHWVGVGDGNTIIRSSNGTTWRLVSP